MAPEDTHPPATRVLLIDDDRDDYEIVRALLRRVEGRPYELFWEKDADAAIRAMAGNDYDAYLVDYQFGARDGLDLIREAARKGCVSPMILFTGRGGGEVDRAALDAGAADYLAKTDITADLLDRSIRYAVDRKRAEQKLLQYQQRLRLLAAEVTAAQRREQRRLASQLHDGLGQLLAVCAIRLGALSPEDLPPGAARTIAETAEMIERAVQEARSMTTALSPPVLYEIGLPAALTWLTEDVGRKHPLDVRLKVEGECGDVPEECREVAFHAARELLHNVVKHAGARNAFVVLRQDNGCLSIEVRDDGRGFDPDGASAAGGFGLFNLRERSFLSGGSLRVHSAAGAGTRVIVSLPLHGGPSGLGPSGIGPEPGKVGA